MTQNKLKEKESIILDSYIQEKLQIGLIVSYYGPPLSAVKRLIKLNQGRISSIYLNDKIWTKIINDGMEQLELKTIEFKNSRLDDAGFRWVDFYFRT